MRKIWRSLGLVVFLTACTTPVSPPPPGAPEFRAGYNDGCAAGYGYAGSPFHAYRGGPEAAPPKTDRTLRAGWLYGFDRCKRSYNGVQRVLAGLFGAP